MGKKSSIPYDSSGFILAMILLVLAFFNLATLFTNWTIGRVHFFIWGGFLISIISIAAGIVYMYWNARWEENDGQSASKDQNLGVGGN